MKRLVLIIVAFVLVSLLPVAVADGTVTQHDREVLQSLTSDRKEARSSKDPAIELRKKRTALREYLLSGALNKQAADLKRIADENEAAKVAEAASKALQAKRAAATPHTHSTPLRSNGSSSLADRGAAFWACIRAHESDTSGGYLAENPTSTASGAYQIINGTWGGFMGYPTASSAPPWVQDLRASQLPKSAWNGSGCPGT